MSQEYTRYKAHQAGTTYQQSTLHGTRRLPKGRSSLWSSSAHQSMQTEAGRPSTVLWLSEEEWPRLQAAVSLTECRVLHFLPNPIQ